MTIDTKEGNKGIPLELAARLAFPVFPPGFWRRIEVTVSPSSIDAALEDDAHQMDLRINHSGGRIRGFTAKTRRAPWSACPEAADALTAALIDQPLDAVGRRDPSMHCTHLLDLAVIAAWLADKPGFHRYDLLVADRINGRFSALLRKDNKTLLWWGLSGTLIQAPALWAGLDLARFGEWKSEIAAADYRHAHMLRRAAFVAGYRRRIDGELARASERGPTRQGVCFTYQPENAARAEWVPGSRRDFSFPPAVPLHGHAARSMD